MLVPGIDVELPDRNVFGSVQTSWRALPMLNRGLSAQTGGGMSQGQFAVYPGAADVARAAPHSHDECLSLVAHELRNPLGPLKNVAALLRQSAPDAPAIQLAAEIIDRQVRAMTLLIDDLLEASGLRAGKIRLRRSSTPITRVLEGALETADPVVRARGHTLHVKTPAQPVVLEADVARLSQVLHNLIVNAAKYTPPGGRIWIDVARDGSDVVVVVRDTGIGLARSELDNVFRLYAQERRETAEHCRGGLGVGLYVARSLVEAHGGTLRAVSQGIGCGSEFVIRLPCDRATAPRRDDRALDVQLLAWESEGGLSDPVARRC